MKRDAIAVFSVSCVSHFFWAIRGIRVRTGDALSASIIPFKDTGDSGTYIAFARNLRFHHVFSFAQGSEPLAPTSFRAPGYPMMIAALGANVYAVVIFQAVLVTLTSLLTYLIAKPFGRRVALIAGIAMALAPMSGAWTGEIMTETLYTFLVTLAIYLWSGKKYAGSGFAFGLSWLVRSTTMPFVLILLVIGFLARSQRPMLKIALVAMLTVAPWTVRNAVVFHRFIPVADGEGKESLLMGTFYIAYHQDVYKQWHQISAQTGLVWNRDTDQMVSLAIERVKADPLHWLVIRLKQYPRFFIDLGSYLYPSSRILTFMIKIGFLMGNILLFALASVGLYLKRSVLPLTLFPIYLTVSHFPIWVEPRFSLPMVPVIIILAVSAGVILMERRQVKNAGQPNIFILV